MNRLPCAALVLGGLLAACASPPTEPASLDLPEASSPDYDALLASRTHPCTRTDRFSDDGVLTISGVDHFLYDSTGRLAETRTEYDGDTEQREITYTTWDQAGHVIESRDVDDTPGSTDLDGDDLEYSVIDTQSTYDASGHLVAVHLVQSAGASPAGGGIDTLVWDTTYAGFDALGHASRATDTYQSTDLTTRATTVVTTLFTETRDANGRVVTDDGVSPDGTRVSHAEVSYDDDAHTVTTTSWTIDSGTSVTISAFDAEGRFLSTVAATPSADGKATHTLLETERWNGDELLAFDDYNQDGSILFDNMYDYQCSPVDAVARTVRYPRAHANGFVLVRTAAGPLRGRTGPGVDLPLPRMSAAHR